MNAHSTPMESRTSCQMTRRSVLARIGVRVAMLLLVVCGVLPLHAQLDTGSIAGTVLDPTGKAVAAAKVAIVGTETGTTYSTVSSATGSYVFPAVRTGKYDLTVSAAGFKNTVSHGVVVAVSGHTSLDVTLTVGSTTEVVSVTAADQTLELDSSTIDDSIQPEQVDMLPLNAGTWRSLESLVTLVPGVVGPGMASSSSDTIKINGGQEMGTDFLIDGLTTLRQQNGSGSFGIFSPSPDAVNEFHVSIASLPIEEGRTTGGVANFNTKSGTNEYHGTVTSFFKNAALDANTWFNNGNMAQQGNTAAAKATYKRGADTKTTSGVTFGGPLQIPHFYNGKNKSFFFFSWEQLRYNYGGPINSQLPTPAELGSDGSYFDFSSLLGSALGTSPCGETVYAGEVMDPQYDYAGSVPCRYAGFGQTVSGTSGSYSVSGSPTNKIPVSRASSIAQNLVNTYLMPLAKQEVSGSSSYNYTYRSAGTITNTGFTIRFDQNLGDKYKVWAFYNSRENTDSGGNSNMPAPIQTCCGTVDQLGKIVRGGWDWIISPTMMNSLTIGGNRSNNINKSKASQMGTDWDSKFGIANGFSNDFPVFTFSGFTFGGMGQQEDSTDIDNVVALNNILHWQKGSHALTFGVEGQYHQYSWVSHIGGTCSGNAGCFQYWANQTASDENYWGQDGNAFAAFLIGETGLASNLNDLHAPRWISHYWAAFAGDTWKVRPNLTVNYGLRYNVETPRHEAAGDTANWDPNMVDAATTAGTSGQALGALVFAGVGSGRNGSKNETWGSTYRKNFEPRVGFAWEPMALNNKGVLRGSMGIYTGPLVYADYGQGSVQGFTVSNNLYTTDPLDGVSLDAGLGALSTKPNLNANQLDGTSTSVDYIAKSNGRPGTVMNWALEAQYQINPHLFATLGYLGMHSTHLHAMLKYMNDMPDKYMQLGDYLTWWAYYPGNPSTGGVGTPLEPYGNFSCSTGCTWGITEPTYQALRPYPQVEYINMDSYLQNLGQSTYEALEAKIEQRFHNGFNVLASYTFSKTLTDADVIQPYWSTLQNGGAVQDPENLNGEKAVSSEDIPQNFVISYIYELPIGRGKAFLGNKSRVVNSLISNWSVSGIQRYQSGQPISIFGATGIPGKNSSIRFNRVAGQSVKNKNYKNPLAFSSKTNATACETGYFNCDAFYDPNLFTNRDAGDINSSGNLINSEGNPWKFGTMPRNSSDIRGFAYKDESFGISKSFNYQRVKVDFRGEMFDAFNRHVFTRPVSDLSSSLSTVGQIGGTIEGPRNVQFHLRISY